MHSHQHLINKVFPVTPLPDSVIKRINKFYEPMKGGSIALFPTKKQRADNK